MPFAGRSLVPFFRCLLLAAVAAGCLPLQAAVGKAATLGDGRLSADAPSVLSDDRAIELLPGDMPLVITVPHGGVLQPAGVPDRRYNPACPGEGRVQAAVDGNTVELAMAIRKAFHDRYGLTPFIVVARVARRSVDLNRDLQEAACAHPAMEHTWNEWHRLVDRAVRTASERYGGALYIDLHGHGHAPPRVELGYLLDMPALQALRDGRPVADGLPHSLENLSHASGGPEAGHRSGRLRDMVFGEQAFGSLLAREGVPAVPSAQDRFPRNGQAYFRGGFNTRRYTGRGYPGVFGWQMEVHDEARRKAARARTAQATMQAVVAFLRYHPGLRWDPPGE